MGEVAAAASEPPGERVVVTPSSSTSAAIVRASSITVRSSRATFSINASSSETAPSTASATSAGMVGQPAIREARQRRSPAISWYPPAERGATMIGCSTPRSRIESASALSDVIKALSWLTRVGMDLVQRDLLRRPAAGLVGRAVPRGTPPLGDRIVDRHGTSRRRSSSCVHRRNCSARTRYTMAGELSGSLTRPAPGQRPRGRTAPNERDPHRWRQPLALERLFDRPAADPPRLPACQHRDQLGRRRAETLGKPRGGCAQLADPVQRCVVLGTNRRHHQSGDDQRVDRQQPAVRRRVDHHSS